MGVGVAVNGNVVGIGSLLCLAASKSSRQVCQAAMKQACRPLRRSPSGKWIFFSGVPKGHHSHLRRHDVVPKGDLVLELLGPFGDLVRVGKEHG